ncbi:MAG: hypothetical protein RL141_163 [Candidatus Parcubacteria bacterium]
MKKSLLPARFLAGKGVEIYPGLYTALKGYPMTAIHLFILVRTRQLYGRDHKKQP